MYVDHEDPWNYAASAYEAEKYAVSSRSLSRARYARALELGCSVGVFTQLLAARCDSLLAVDVSPDAVERARARCAGAPQVRVAVCDLCTDFPPGRFDLVTFCELGFYFGPRDLQRIRERIAHGLEPNGELLLVHWLPLVEGHAQTADDVHEAFLGDARFTAAHGVRARTYRLDVLRRSAP